MNDRPLTKAQRREVRDLAGLAHERELAQAVGELQTEFERWRGGEIDVFELNERIQKFHDGTSRDLYKRYVMGKYQWCSATYLLKSYLGALRHHIPEG